MVLLVLEINRFKNQYYGFMLGHESQELTC